MNFVFFLGAGFSKTFGMPIMTDFFYFARNSNRISEEDKSFIDDLILEARRANSFLLSSTTNLEDILSFAIMGERLKVSKNPSKRSEKLIKILQKLFTNYPFDDDYWSRYDNLLNQFLGSNFSTVSTYDNMKIREKFKSNTTFITTNYDINLESLLFQSKLSTYPGFDFKRLNINEHVHSNFYSNNGIPLYKLHGSVNWFKDGQNYSVDDNITLNTVKRSTVPNVCKNISDLLPVIIPPSFLKPDLSNVSKKIWQAASLALSKADYLIIIGYSFPLTDVEMKYFFSKSFSENPKIGKILIIDPFADSIIAKLKEPRNGFGNQFKELLMPVDENWEEVDLKIEFKKIGIDFNFDES